MLEHGGEPSPHTMLAATGPHISDLPPSPDGEREQPADGGRGGDQDRHHAATRGVDRSVLHAHAGGATLVGGVDEHDRRVHRDAGERDHPVQRVERQRIARHQQAEHHPGEGERHGQQDDQRLPVAAELGGGDGIMSHAERETACPWRRGSPRYPPARRRNPAPRPESAAGLATPPSGGRSLHCVEALAVELGLYGDRARELVVADVALGQQQLLAHQFAELHAATESASGTGRCSRRRRADSPGERAPPPPPSRRRRAWWRRSRPRHTGAAGGPPPPAAPRRARVASSSGPVSSRSTSSAEAPGNSSPPGDDADPVEVDLRVLCARHGQVAEDVHERSPSRKATVERMIVDQPPVEAVQRAPPAASAGACRPIAKRPVDHLRVCRPVHRGGTAGLGLGQHPTNSGSAPRNRQAPRRPSRCCR